MAAAEMVATWCVAACVKQVNSLPRWVKAGGYAVGLGLLRHGSWYLDVPGWDPGISLVLAVTTQAIAEWLFSGLWQRRWCGNHCGLPDLAVV